MVKFEGKYKRTQQEKYDEFLAKLGLNYLTRKAATASTPTMEISQPSPGKWRIVNSTKLRTTEINFEFDKEFKEETPDGRSCLTTVTQRDETTWVTNQRAQKPGQKSVEVIREFTNEGMKIQMRIEDVVSKQVFERI